MEFNEAKVAYKKTYSKERGSFHDRQAAKIVEILQNRGYDAKIFQKRSKLNDLLYGDYEVNGKKVDHKSSKGNETVFISYNSATKFEGDFYSTKKDGKFKFFEPEPFKPIAKAAEEAGELVTSNGYKGNKNLYKSNNYQINTPDGPMDLGIRVKLSSIKFSKKNFD